MEKEITQDNNSILLKPQNYYDDIGSVKIETSKNPISEEWDDEMGMIRLYQHYCGDSVRHENSFTLQLRAFKKLTETSKPKSFIASALLRDSEIMAIAEFVNQKRKEHDIIRKFPATNDELNDRFFLEEIIYRLSKGDFDYVETLLKDWMKEMVKKFPLSEEEREAVFNNMFDPDDNRHFNSEAELSEELEQKRF